MKHYAGRNNPVWGFDSFEGMPELSEKDSGDGQKWVGYICSGERGEQQVYNTLKQLGVNQNNFHLVKGWFEDTLVDRLNNIGEISILRLDNDWYESTKFCLETLYSKVISGGVIIIDDYYSFAGCRKAVDEFRESNKISAELQETEKHSEVFWFKSV